MRATDSKREQERTLHDPNMKATGNPRWNERLDVTRIVMETEVLY